MLNQDFKEFVALLNQNKVDYLVVGGYAVAIHGHPPNRINLLTQVDGLEFEPCYPEKIIVDIEGVAVNFIDLENLKKNKLATGRFQDLADLENLQ
jgi:hypothetical protein